MMPEGLNRIKSARILVVEDSVANQTLAHDLLKHAGCHVDLAGNGMEAIKAIRTASEPYDAVLMDLQMPIMDGLEATAVIRGELSHDNLPIIATTANIGKKEQERCLAAGANDCLPKPFHIHELYAIMIRWVNLGERTTETPNKDETDRAAPATAEATLPNEIDGVDIEGGLGRVGRNRNLYAGLLVEFADTNARLDRDIDAAFNDGDLERIRFLAHGIRSTAGNIGADALSNVAAELERLIVDDGGGVAATLKGFRTELERVVSAIHAADVAAHRGPTPRMAGASAFNRGEAENLIGTLLDMLDDQDLGAQREFEKLAAILGGQGHDESMDELGENLAALEFSNARRILARVGKEILG
jgi:CheY-like chemotaxis protein